MNGKKTYIVAVLMILHALSAYVLGQDASLNFQEILAALGLSALRAGVKKAEHDDSPTWGNPSSFILGALCSLCVHSASAADGGGSRLTAREDARPTGQLGTWNSELGTNQAQSESYSNASSFHFDSYVAARTCNFDDATYGYGTGIGYQVSPYWSTDLRAIVAAVCDRRNRARMCTLFGAHRAPLQFLSAPPLQFLSGLPGASFD